MDSDYVPREVPKAQPEMPVRVFLNSQLIAALRQHARPIVIEDQVLARPFVRLLRARDLRLGMVGALLELKGISYAINRYYGADIEAHWSLAPPSAEPIEDIAMPRSRIEARSVRRCARLSTRTAAAP